MIFAEMLLEGIVVDKVLLVTALPSSIADVTTFVLVSAMCVQLIIAIEPHATEATFRVAFESALVNCARMVIPESFVFPQILWCKQLMLVSEDFLVPRAQVTHDFVMNALDMVMQMWPAQASLIAAMVRTVVTEKDYCVGVDVVVCVLDAQRLILMFDLRRLEVLESFAGVIGEYEVLCFSLKAISGSIWIEERVGSPDNGHKHASYIVCEVAEHIYGMCGGCTVPPSDAVQVKHR